MPAVTGLLTDFPTPLLAMAGLIRKAMHTPRLKPTAMVCLTTVILIPTTIRSANLVEILP